MRRLTRRTFAGGTVAAWLLGPLARAATPLPRTPWQTEGPFYPVGGIRGDHNLLHAAGPGSLARGRLLRLRGRVVDPSRTPLPGLRVEIWQVDHQGIYDHPRAHGQQRRDPAFRGHGATVTGDEGRYEFLTIVPATYPGRPPHIHFKVHRGAEELLTSQIYLADHPANARDWILSRALDSAGEADLFIAPAPQGRYAGRPLEAAEFPIVIESTS